MRSPPYAAETMRRTSSASSSVASRIVGACSSIAPDGRPWAARVSVSTAAGPASGRRRHSPAPVGPEPCVAAGRYPGVLPLQVLPALEAALRERAVRHRGGHGAARLPGVGAVAEPAPGGELLDVGEGPGRAPARRRSGRRPAVPGCRSRPRRAAAPARDAPWCAGPFVVADARVLSTSAPTRALVSEDLPWPEAPTSAAVSRPGSRERRSSTPAPSGCSPRAPRRRGWRPGRPRRPARRRRRGRPW